ncbi:phosphotransferase [Stackebrandtia nassauensis]|uniref:Aminoglycoside phosphotransferase n=1 Tax=Stackebrandtia nassauensis (strain DSM 44728 / CIP 108903 / NRRL B-16338 / NBRC 102104 / LLR-40K-21) TaxID=446470 RepID=D3PYX9_STANL|nr:phosphotransferase [Stackebrandtia nassauensis]ADD45408.1 aminoglycoside phosphotransferase [Stackebrandtia nassauensis DSM 44728]
MSEFMSPEQLADRTERALTAAAEAGRDLGLEVTEPTVLYDSFSVVVHLKPSPVVVRMPTVLPTFLTDLDTQSQRQRLELDVAGWLARQGLPVVTPSPLVPAEPVRRNGFSMTFWQFVEHDQSAEPDYVANAAAAAKLHHNLRDYPGQLSFMSVLDMIPSCLDELGAMPELIDAADLDRARAEWELLEPVLGSPEGFARAFPDAEVRPIHGDSPPFNMIPTADGLLYSDFEDPTLGPVEWDLTLVGPDGEAAYNEAAQALGMRTLDERLLAVLTSTRMLQVVACLAMVPQMPPMLDGLKEAMEHWRNLPLAGGLGEG